MITLDDVRPGAPAAPPRVATIADTWLHGALWLTVASSFFVFVQPAPYEFLFAILAFTCLVAGVAIDLKVLPLLFLMTLRDVTGIPSLTWVLDKYDSLQFFAISAYLGITATVFACIFAQDVMRRIATAESGYVFAGVIGTVLGLIGYFQLVPGFEIFVLNDRVVSGFKDPNVFGPFLIPPLLWLMAGMITDRIKFLRVVWALVIATGWLLAYSRAAWVSGVVSGAIMVWLLFITAPDNRLRKRILIFVGISLAASLALFAVLMSIDLVHDMLEKRFGLQSYDTGTEGSRINTQAKALAAIPDYPLGMGPWEFMRQNQLAAHNTIMGTLLNLGWIAGFAWVAHLLLTAALGFRCLLVRTPWQPFLIATYASFIGALPIAFVIDTDHWRHYYLQVGIIWGLSIATINLLRRERARTAASFAMSRSR